MAGKDVRGEVEKRAEGKFKWGIAVIAFVFVVREVIETVLFLTPFAIAEFASTALGAAAGVAVAITLAVLILRFEYRMSLRRFLKRRDSSIRSSRRLTALELMNRTHCTTRG